MDSQSITTTILPTLLALEHPGHYVLATKTSLVIKMNEALLKKTLRNSQICQKSQRTEFSAT